MTATRQRPQAPERTPRGRLVVTLVDREGRPAGGRGSVFATEHRPAFAPQHRVDGDAARPFALEVPVGAYTIQGAVKGAVGRAGAVVQEQRATEVRLTVAAHRSPRRTLADRLRPYGLDGRVQPRPLELESGTDLVLDASRFHDKRDFTVLAPASVDDLKRWVGTPDAAFDHDLPRYGELPDVPTKIPSRLDADQESAWRRIAREYIHGNSKTVARFKDALDARLAKRPSRVPVFHFTVVTIPARATLTIGKNSNVFVCDELRIHKLGTLRVVGDVRVDIGTYRVFG